MRQTLTIELDWDLQVCIELDSIVTLNTTSVCVCVCVIGTYVGKKGATYDVVQPC